MGLKTFPKFTFAHIVGYVLHLYLDHGEFGDSRTGNMVQDSDVVGPAAHAEFVHADQP